jgi:hypothetical protein
MREFICDWEKCNPPEPVLATVLAILMAWALLGVLMAGGAALVAFQGSSASFKWPRRDAQRGAS